MEIALTDGTWLEGKDGEGFFTSMTTTGIWLKDAHRSREGEAGSVPIGKKVFVPHSAILFVVVEK